MNPDYEENYEGLGTVRFYEENGQWRYIHARGEGGGFDSLEAAQAEVEFFLSTPVEDSEN